MHAEEFEKWQLAINLESENTVGNDACWRIWKMIVSDQFRKRNYGWKLTKKEQLFKKRWKKCKRTMTKLLSKFFNQMRLSTASGVSIWTADCSNSWSLVDIRRRLTRWCKGLSRRSVSTGQRRGSDIQHGACCLPYLKNDWKVISTNDRQRKTIEKRSRVDLKWCAKGEYDYWKNDWLNW